MEIKLFTILFFIVSTVFARDLYYTTACNPNNSEATISFVGDILIHKALYQVVVKESQHFSQIWQKTDRLIQKANFSVGNLEGPSAMGIDIFGKDRGDIGFVYDGQVYSGTNYIFNYHPRILSDLKSSGYDLLTTANNHALDRYAIGIDKTIAAAKNNQLLTVGTRMANNPEEDFYKIAIIDNLRVAFLGCTEFVNFSDFSHQVLSCGDKKIFEIIRDVSARADVDAIVVLPHWGIEYSHTPTSYQRDYARRYLDAGAIAVVGSHPHVLQPWEKYVTKNGRETLILYSLGNFVAGQAGLARKTGTVFYLGLSKNGNQKATIFGVGYTPTFRINSELVPIGTGDSTEILNHVALMYGTKARIGPAEKLLPVMCEKTNY